jgi:hypothetical protein
MRCWHESLGLVRDMGHWDAIDGCEWATVIRLADHAEYSVRVAELLVVTWL